MEQSDSKFIYRTHLEQYVGTAHEIVIPEGVAVIDYRAFCNNKSNITAVTFPSTIEEIDNDAFLNCMNLKTVVFPHKVKRLALGCDTFSNCTALESVRLPDGTDCLWDTFTGCTALSDITLPDSIRIIGDFAFRNCINLKKVKLPANLKYISRNSFQGCTGLTEILIPEGIADIWEHAFQNCESLQNVQIPNGVIHIGEEAFAGCIRLSGIFIPNSVTYIGKKAFSGCDKDFVLRSSNPVWKKYAKKEKLKFELINDPCAK